MSKLPLLVKPFYTSRSVSRGEGEAGTLVFKITWVVDGVKKKKTIWEELIFSDKD